MIKKEEENARCFESRKSERLQCSCNRKTTKKETPAMKSTTYGKPICENNPETHGMDNEQTTDTPGLCL